MLSITLGHTDRQAHRQHRLSNCCCCSARVKWMTHQQHPRVWQVASRLLRLRAHKGNGSKHCVYNGFVIWRNGMEEGEGGGQPISSSRYKLNPPWQMGTESITWCVCACLHVHVCVCSFFLFFSTPFCCLSTHLDIYAVMYFSSQWLLIGRITVNDRNALAGGGNAEATTALSCTLILFFHRCCCCGCGCSCIAGSGSRSGGSPRCSRSSCFGL